MDQKAGELLHGWGAWQRQLGAPWYRVGAQAEHRLRWELSRWQQDQLALSERMVLDALTFQRHVLHRVAGQLALSQQVPQSMSATTAQLEGVLDRWLLLWEGLWTELFQDVRVYQLEPVSQALISPGRGPTPNARGWAPGREATGAGRTRLH